MPITDGGAENSCLLTTINLVRMPAYRAGQEAWTDSATALCWGERPLKTKFRGYRHWQELAGIDVSERLVLKVSYGCNGSACDSPRFEFIAGKRPVKFASWKQPVVIKCSRPFAVSQPFPKPPFGRAQSLRN